MLPSRERLEIYTCLRVRYLSLSLSLSLSSRRVSSRVAFGSKANPRHRGVVGEGCPRVARETKRILSDRETQSRLKNVGIEIESEELKLSRWLSRWLGSLGG